jgi:signal transduction histidine kinase
MGFPIVVPVPIVNGVWGGAVILGVAVAGFAEISMLELNINAVSIEPTHQDGSGGYSMIVKGFTKILELYILGIGIFFASFYYFVSHMATVTIVASGLFAILGLYFVFVYRIHVVLQDVKETKMNLLTKEIEELEKTVEVALEQNDLPQAAKSWIRLAQRKESLASTRIRELRTWPIDMPIISRLGSLAALSFFLQIMIPLIIEFLVRS